MRLSDFGFKRFSQGDEDGILAEILRRLEIQTGRFVEIGVGPGGENNTRWLAESGWSGWWFGKEPLVAHPAGVVFVETTITPQDTDIIAKLPCDVFSLDIDGNDYWVLKSLLASGFQPNVIVVEYNGTYDAKTRYVMPYTPNYEWHTGQPFGASLASWTDLLDLYGYTLVECSSSGANAFFVQHCGQFLDVLEDRATLYRPLQIVC